MPGASTDITSLGDCLSEGGLSDEEGGISSTLDHAQQRAAQQLAAAQKVRELEAQLEAAAAQEALLRDSVAARDDTIRCCQAQSTIWPNSWNRRGRNAPSYVNGQFQLIYYRQ